ncbi:hypothetical protein M885DRAFT_512232 [Pelagophyceae sp. CCMP2097]|nr:hypothetical protein M885DRAFT_512232 [Pelagophyceae sp. CCMP2097]
MRVVLALLLGRAAALRSARRCAAIGPAATGRPALPSVRGSARFSAERGSATRASVRLGARPPTADETSTKLPANPLLRTAATLTFDTRAYALREAVLGVLALPSETDLSAAHLVSGWHTDRSGNRVNQLQCAWNANRDRGANATSRDAGVARFIPQDASERYEAFEAVYLRFITDVVAPSLGGGRVLFQRAPTLRVMAPLEGASGQSVMSKLHNDMDYHHQPSEVNFWLPLSRRVWGGNTMWAESKPLAGDLAPLELNYGEMRRFYGNQCRHQARDNDTGVCRVSMDFRALSEASGGHDADFRRGVRRGAKARYQACFDTPDFYSEVTVPICDIVAAQ